MSEIDFGTLVSRVLLDMDYTESNLTGDERRDTHKALVHYKRDVVQAIREVFDEAEAPAPEPPTCSKCGAVLGEGARFCGRCRMPLSEEAAADLLGEVFAKELDTTPYDPRFREALARFRKEMPEEWDALVQKITSPVRPKNEVGKPAEDLEDLALLEIAVPRGWRDFLHAFPEWKDFDPDICDSLAEELRGGMRAQLEMILSEIHGSNPRKAVEYGRRYGLMNLYPFDHINDCAATEGEPQ
ncbi:hypothetical protein [Methanoculleus sp.]|uniref:hypothetical protein n=1 Tax=Methanoculleus sp. TaxID=90427 RepID=UPI001BD5871C|nr:hypothetical protein [Methanoculleus sp.]